MQEKSDGRFPATRRLKRRGDFERVYRSGIAWKGDYFSLYLLSSGCVGRMGIVITRRWGNAVERNKMKRFLREIFRQHPLLFSEIDMIVQPQKTCKGKCLGEIERHLIEEFKAASRPEETNG